MKNKQPKLVTIKAPIGALIVPKDMQVSWAVKTIVAEMKKDKDYRRSWKDNIAMAFKDNYVWYKEKTGKVVMNIADRHNIANDAADYFLKLLCDEIKRY